MDFLKNPEHWKVTWSKEGPYTIDFEAVSLDQLEACPKCGAPKERLRPNGVKKRHLIDAPQLSKTGKLKRVQIVMTLRRYVCGDCGKSSLQPLEGVTGKERVTTRLKLFAAREGLLRQYTDVARLTQLSRRHVRELSDEYGEFLDRTERQKLAKVVCMDGVYYARAERILLTDPERKLALEVFPGGDAEKILADIKERFTDKERARVRVVVIDMSATLRCVAAKAFPNATIVIDRFHVFKKANKAVDGVREALRKERKKERREGRETMVRSEILRKHRADMTEEQEAQLDRWLGILPRHREAYEVKELLSTLWFSSSPETAEGRYEEWLGELAKCSPLVRAQFKKHFTKAVDDWGKDIFAYFDDRFDNGFTERMNRDVKDLQADCRRLSFNSMRKKIVYGTLVKRWRDEEEAQHTKERVARLKKPRKGPWTVTQKPRKQRQQPAAPATHLSPKPKGARGRRPQPLLPFPD